MKQGIFSQNKLTVPFNFASIASTESYNPTAEKGDCENCGLREFCRIYKQENRIPSWECKKNSLPQ